MVVRPSCRGRRRALLASAPACGRFVVPRPRSWVRGQELSRALMQVPGGSSCGTHQRQTGRQAQEPRPSRARCRDARRCMDGCSAVVPLQDHLARQHSSAIAGGRDLAPLRWARSTRHRQAAGESSANQRGVAGVAAFTFGSGSWFAPHRVMASVWQPCRRNQNRHCRTVPKWPAEPFGRIRLLPNHVTALSTSRIINHSRFGRDLVFGRSWRLVEPCRPVPASGHK